MTKLLEPKTLLAIKDLSLAAKLTIDGFMSGLNKSLLKGEGIEFSQYRTYQPGDDLRALDWKMYARSDRYYLRESEVETSISIRFLLDASASMNHQDGEFTKIDYARYLAASLGYLGSVQGDAIGLNVMNENGLFSMFAKRDKQHLARFFYQLEQVRAEGFFLDSLRFKELYATDMRDLLVVISDLYEPHDEISKLLESLAASGQEVILFHIMGKNELEFDFKGYSSFEDLETGKRLQIDQKESRKEYKKNLSRYLEETRKKALDKGIFYQLLSMGEPLDSALRAFLKRRNHLKS